jgi:Spy/CpxP family protein refolding chaperone
MKLNKCLMMAGMAAVLSLGSNQLVAQDNNSSSTDNKGGGGRGGRGGGGNFDPAQRMDRYKEQLEIKDDTEWKAVQPLIQKVMDTQRAVVADRMRGMFSRFRGGDNNNSGDQKGRGRGGFGGDPSPESEALQKAIEGKAPNSEIKAALAKYLEARKAKEADLEKAQAELRKVLTVRQEAIASLNGLL